MRQDGLNKNGPGFRLHLSQLVRSDLYSEISTVLKTCAMLVIPTQLYELTWVLIIMDGWQYNGITGWSTSLSGDCAKFGFVLTFSCKQSFVSVSQPFRNYKHSTAFCCSLPWRMLLFTIPVLRMGLTLTQPVLQLHLWHLEKYCHVKISYL